MMEHSTGAYGENQPLFAAANSGRGFVSFYAEIFDSEEIERRYLIKGGPGTGKSSLMRRLAADAERKGRTVSYYRCSSDPESLDAIVIDRRIAVLDATAPHAVEPKVAGARDELVNLGAFWDGDRLAEHYNEIVSLLALKESAYRRAYRFLSATLELSEINRELVAPAILQEKLCAAVERQMRLIPSDACFRVHVGLADSIGMRGSVRLDTYEKRAKRLWVIDDCYGIGTLYLSRLIEAARQKKCRISVSYQPLDPTLPDAVLFEESGVCFLLAVTGEREAGGRINMKRFLSTEQLGTIKADYRFGRRLYEATLQSAKEALAEAGEYHFRLERLYGACMDFEALEAFSTAFCQRVLG